LTWVTLTEINNDYFEVERSFDGSRYEVVGKVLGNDNSNIEIKYTLDDKDIRQNGVYTYRLRQVDFDGRESYTRPIEISVERQVDNSTNIYPNPSIGQVNVEVIASEGQQVSVNVYDNTGKLVLASLLNSTSEGKEMNAKIDQGLLSKGIYYIMINIDGNVSSHKLIIVE